MASRDPIERMGSSLLNLRLWLFKGWRMAVLMTKGSYLLAERRRLFLKLGEEVYRQMLEGPPKGEPLEPTVHQIDRLTKKIAVEEVLINRIRFGKRPAPQAAAREGGGHAAVE